MNDILSQAAAFKRSVEEIASNIVDKKTKDCFRVYKAKVVTAPFTEPNGNSYCEVLLAEDATNTSNKKLLPYASNMASMQVGDLVLVAVLFGSWRNAIVWDYLQFKNT